MTAQFFPGSQHLPEIFRVVADWLSIQRWIVKSAGLREGGRITGVRIRQEGLELKERQAEIAIRIEQYQKGEEAFRATLETLISLASQAANIFARSKTDQKRQLIALLFSNPAPEWAKS